MRRQPLSSEAAKADTLAASDATETPATRVIARAGGSPTPPRRPGPPVGLVAQLMLGFAVAAAAAGTYLVLKLPRAALPQPETARAPLAATGASGAEPSQKQPRN